MHSRKTRINDGYYESQSRSFQNSNKYNSSSRYSNYYTRDRDTSPTKRVAHRSPSPEGSPSRDSRDRYHQSSSYRNKDRDRDYKKEKYPDKRGRDRDIEYKNYKKAKTRERSSSDEDHKESDRVYEKQRYDRDHNNAVRRPSEKERRFGDWKEMISKGSGKKYYYNERDKSSQWDKPEEWVEYEMQKEYSSLRGYRDKERDRKCRDERYGRRNYNSKHSRANSRSRWPHESYQGSASSSAGHPKRHEENHDMDISPDSTPTSEPSYSSPTANQHINNSNINSNSLNHNDDVMTSPNGHATKHGLNATNSNNNQLHHQISNASTSSLNSISKLNSNSNKNSTTTSSSSPSTHNYQAHHHHRNRSTSPSDVNSSSAAAAVSLHNNVGHDTNNLHHHNSNNSLRNSPSYSGGGNSSTNAVSAGLNNSVSRLELNNSSNNSNHLIGDGPPTPEMDLNSGEHRRLDATTSGVSSLQSVLSVSQTSNRLNLLTPSLAKFFRADLITHVTNWPSEILEKQAQKCAEEVYLLGDLECSKISAEIQCARSIVRVAEIAATIQTQRRLFLQEQIKSLDESQTQNSSTISY